LQDDYETVQVYNAPQVNDDYLALYAGKNAPDKVYKNGAHTVKVEILSNQITDATAPDRVATATRRLSAVWLITAPATNIGMPGSRSILTLTRK
jgi:type IV secretion system protein VirB8